MASSYSFSSPGTKGWLVGRQYIMSYVLVTRTLHTQLHANWLGHAFLANRTEGRGPEMSHTLGWHGGTEWGGGMKGALLPLLKIQEQYKNSWGLTVCWVWIVDCGDTHDLGIV